MGSPSERGATFACFSDPSGEKKKRKALMAENPHFDTAVQLPRPEEPREEPAAQLIREALDEMRNLVRLEVALAREEAQSELARAKASAIALAAAAVLAISAFSLFMVAIAASFGSIWLAALICLRSSAGVRFPRAFSARPNKG
jgi:hypothetical protein